MAESDINIQYLPEPILEEIFQYISVKVIRSVCRHFKFIVDNSSKLMANYEIKANLIDNLDWEINSFYQNINAGSFKALDLETKFGNKLAKHLKSLKMSITKSDIILALPLIQSALFSSNNLQEIFITFSTEFDHRLDAAEPLLRNIKKPTFSALKSLTFKMSLNAGITIRLFTDSPQLKKLTTDSLIDLVAFGGKTIWKLDELNLGPTQPDFAIIEFIDDQRSTLKRLRIHDNSILSDIVRKLPSLEKLCLYKTPDEDDDFDDQNLIPGYNLKTLSLINSQIDSRFLKKLLMHYKNIEKLYIDALNNINFNDLVLSNLSHITVSCFCASLLWRLKMENLKSLTLIGDELTLEIVEQIPAENLQRVEKLKVKNELSEDILVLIGHFPSLKHLYLISEDIVITETELNDILATTSLKSIHLMESQWKVDKKPLDYLSETGNAELIIKLYSTTSNMINDDEKEIQEICFGRNSNNSEDDLFSDLDELNFSTGSSENFFYDLEMYGV